VASDGCWADHAVGHIEFYRLQQGIIPEQFHGFGVIMRNKIKRATGCLHGLGGAEVHVTVPIVQSQNIEITVTLLLHHGLRQFLGGVMAVARLAHELAPDVVRDRETLGFVLGRVDGGTDAKLLDPLWKRFRFHTVKNRFGSGKMIPFSGIFQESHPEKVDECRSGWVWRS